MTGQWPPTPVTVLTPVIPGREAALAAHLADLERETSPFHRLASTHIARLLMVGQVPPLAGIPTARRPLRMRYLLFTAVANSPAEDLFEELRTEHGPAVDSVWDHCVHYPGVGHARLFDAYMTRNSLPAQQWFGAYDATVTQVREALELRRDHLAFARAAQGADRLTLLDRFRERWS